VITSVAAQTIANQCYDQATLNNPFCSLFERAGASGGTRGEVPFQILEGSLLQSTLNFAKLTARGIDTNLSYRKRFDWGAINLGAIWTHTLERDSYTNPADPARINRILGELADPTDEVRVNASFKTGGVTLGYEVRWIDKMYLNTYEDFNSLQGRPPENADYAPIQQYPDVFYHNIRMDYDLNDRFNLYLGLDNVTNKMPPLGLTGVGAGSGIYDVRGRYGYAGFVAKF
jgi:outer membrane receptor protein involved in Fe transport